jgi:S-disulfanyl-L-cysteine oxidoreductase SoxD
MPKHCHRCWAAILLLGAISCHALATPSSDMGREPTSEEIARWDIAIGPQGAELPPGQGTASKGAEVFSQKCAMCHGLTGREGPDAILVGGYGTLNTSNPVKTIGSYWPWATTIYDYIRRAMPLAAPGSLSAEEVYSLTAYLLYENGIIQQSTIMDASSLPRIKMPNRDGFKSNWWSENSANELNTP